MGGFDFLMYGAAAAGIVVYVLWLILAEVWRAGSTLERSVLTGLLALAVAVISNDIRARRWSMLSRLLVGAWALALIFLVLLELLA